MKINPYKPVLGQKLNVDTYEMEDFQLKREISTKKAIRSGIIILFLIAMVFIWLTGCAWADTITIKQESIAGYSLNQWCNAIYKAEGGAKTAHPYGILKRYTTTTPLEACKNTVRHKYSNWKREGRHGTFLSYLGAKYCPVGCDNDTGNNKNWINNVKYWLERV